MADMVSGHIAVAQYNQACHQDVLGTLAISQSTLWKPCKTPIGVQSHLCCRWFGRFTNRASSSYDNEMGPPNLEAIYPSATLRTNKEALLLCLQVSQEVWLGMHETESQPTGQKDPETD